MPIAPDNLRQPHFARIILDPSPGTLLADVCRSAQYLADDGQTLVYFRHNGWQFVAQPGGDAEVMLARWECETKLPSIHRLPLITSTCCPPKENCHD